VLGLGVWGLGFGVWRPYSKTGSQFPWDLVQIRQFLE